MTLISTDICSDTKQLLYTSCTYIYPSGTQCGSPIPLYLNPPLCGGHCDTALSPANDDVKSGEDIAGNGRDLHVSATLGEPNQEEIHDKVAETNQVFSAGNFGVNLPKRNVDVSVEIARGENTASKDDIGSEPNTTQK